MWILAGLLAGITFGVASQTSPSHRTESSEKAIRAVLNAQVVAWNAGDIDGFMKGYEDSPQTTFIGHTVRHGYAEILANYKNKYSDKARMGTLTFTDIDIRMLSTANAVVTGKYKLDFPDTGAQEQEGIFSLVLANTAQGWKIVLDHTS
jgi:uncharacterized protein (TIGR02246 family)